MSKQLRIGTWNVHYGIEYEALLGSMVAHKEFKNIDFLALQEASVHNDKETAEIVAGVLGRRYNYFQFTTERDNGIPWANAIVWNEKKVNVTKKDILILPPFYSVKLRRLEKQVVRFLHKQIRTSVVIEGTTQDISFRFYIAHFDVIGLRHKRMQFWHIIEDNRSREKKDIELIAGDLNTFRILRRPRWTKIQKDAEQEGFKDITTDIRWTFAHDRFRYKQKLDAIFIKSQLQFTYESWSSNIPGSDHIPVFANLALP